MSKDDLRLHNPRSTNMYEVSFCTTIRQSLCFRETTIMRNHIRILDAKSQASQTSWCPSGLWDGYMFLCLLNVIKDEPHSAVNENMQT